MKSIASNLILLLATSCVVPFSVDAGDIELTRKWELYQIKGWNQSDLRKAMNAKGPINTNTGKRFDARTDWKLGWKYKYDKNSKNQFWGPKWTFELNSKTKMISKYILDHS